MVDAVCQIEKPMLVVNGDIKDAQIRLLLNNGCKGLGALNGKDYKYLDIEFRYPWQYDRILSPEEWIKVKNIPNYYRTHKI
jgi:hypothetical protein